MEKLAEKYYQKLDRTSVAITRSLLHHIDWSNRFIGIKGARGTGKTTLLLQYIHIKKLPPEQTLYVSLDDLYFTENKLADLADRFVKNNGKYLLLDEVHRYPNWSSELKNIYDDHPELQLVFTGSSLIHIERAKGDLSRRAVMYELPGLSFREFLHFEGVLHQDAISLDELILHHMEVSRTVARTIKPLAFFKTYLQYGYYPYYLENKNAYHQKLAETINIALHTDLPASYGLHYGSIEKIRLLLHVIAESVPFKPNITKLSERIGTSRNSLLEFLRYLEEMRIVRRLYADTKGIGILQKPEKLYLFHPNLNYALSNRQNNTGNMRESFFLNQLAAVGPVAYASQGDFVSAPYTFEIGGKSKTTKQIREVAHAFVAADDIEIGHNRTIPLWLFGFLY